MAEKKSVREQTESLIKNRQTYQITVGGTVDGVNTRDPIGYSAYGQGWENNQWVRMENVGSDPVINPWIQVNDQPSWRSTAEILAGILSPDMEEAEKARAIWEFARHHRYHRTTADDEVKDTVKMLNSYGYTLCWDEAYTVSNLWQAAGLKIRRGMPHGHCTTEVYFDGAYHLLDSDEHLLYLLRDNQTIASEEDLAHDHDLIKRGHAYGILSAENRRASEQAASLFTYEGPRSGGRPIVGDHCMNLTLRPGETLIWAWQDRDKYHGYNGKPPRLCNGYLSFVPRLDADFAQWAEEAENLEVGSESLVAIDENAETHLVYRIESPYVIVGGHIDVDGEVSIEIQTHSGTWRSVDGDLDPHFPPAGPACYSYALRLRGRGASIRSIEIKNDLQMAPLSLPALRTGTNQILYTDQSSNRQVNLTHAWQERDDIQAPAAVSTALFPADGAEPEGTQLTFKWSALADASDYHFELSPRADMRYALSPVFEKLISKTPSANQAEWTIPEEGLLNPGTTYYWRVRARGAAGLWGPWSQIWRFTPQAPGNPLDLALSVDWENRTIDLHWHPNPDGQLPVRYEVHASNERGFTARRWPHTVYRGNDEEETVPSNLIATTENTSLRVVGSKINDGNYAFYRVIAVDAKGNRSGPSDYATAPHPFIYSTPPAQARANHETIYQIQSLRSIGDLRSESNGPQRYFSAFRDSETLHYLLDEGPPFITLDPDDGQLRAAPGPEHLGFHTITFRVLNDRGGVDLQGFDLEVTNL